MQLVGNGTSTTGQGATARITVNGSGTITGVKIMDGGSAYGIGNTMNVIGVTATQQDLFKVLFLFRRFIVILVIR